MRFNKLGTDWVALLRTERCGINQNQANYYAHTGQIYEWLGKLRQAAEAEAYEHAERLDPL